MTTTPRDPLDPEQLASYDVPGAPAGFADRVMAAVAAPESATATATATRSRSPRGALAALGALAAVLAIALGWSLLRGQPAAVRAGAGDAHGAHVAAARETIALGGRGLAVAEPGTQLRWDVADDGAARVEQDRGSAFYRVERGGTFEVATPLGVVTVTGTCFSVEVSMGKPSKDSIRGAMIGAALATAVVVTVYEGGVSFARGGDRVRAGAGDSVVARAGESPQVRGGGGLAATASAQAELAIARARVADLEHQLAGSSGGSGAAASSATRRRPTDDDPTAYFAPTHDQLADMAATCTVAYDMPPFGGDHDDLVSADTAAQAGLGDADRAAVDDAYRAVEARDLAQLRALYVELTGVEPDAAATLSPNAIVDDIEAKSDPADAALARKRISAERAGLAPAPSAPELASHAIVERMLRVEANLGNDAEAAAAGVLGGDRARALRAITGTGWNGSTHSHGGCGD